MSQRFQANVKHEFANGAIGWAPGGSMDCLGPYAKVQNCPIKGASYLLTCYATDYADTWFSVPAQTRRKGKTIKGFFTLDEGGIFFNPYDCHKEDLK